MYDLIIFDLDGTLLDSDKMIIETFKELYPMFRPGYMPSEEHMLSFSGPQIKETLKKEFPNIDSEVAMKAFREHSLKNYDKYAKLFPNVKEMFVELNKRHIPFAVVTNKHRYATEYTYKLFGISELIPFTVCADDVEHLKPAGDGIIQCMKYFGVSELQKVIYVGDGAIDYQTAQNAGVKFGYVTWSTRHLEKNAKIDHYIENYQQFLEEIK